MRLLAWSSLNFHEQTLTRRAYFRQSGCLGSCSFKINVVAKRLGKSQKYHAIFMYWSCGIISFQATS